MKFWDDTLRVCSKCKCKVSFTGEEQKQCPKCGATVWFFSYRKLPSPPPVPELPGNDFFSNRVSNALLVAIVALSLTALLSFVNSLVVGVVSALAAAGFCMFAMIRHTEALAVEQKVIHYAKVLELCEAYRNQTSDLTQRYLALLETGNVRIEHYFGQIYEAAERERKTADVTLQETQKERLAIKSVEDRIYMMAERLVNDHQKWIAAKLRADPESYQRHKTTLTKTFDFVEVVGYTLPQNLRKSALEDLKKAYQEKVREQTLKEEQRRIKQQMREELQIQREQERAIREAEEREAELADRLKVALASQAGVQSQKIKELQQQLAEAQMKADRAKSLAQLTKVGHVYILSNIGSFGEDVFKVGMTRREDPSHRVRELGDASVPFPFDVHAMISCDNAPALENALHRELARYRVNRINLRKEYFRINLEEILKAVTKHHGAIEYIAAPEALEYRETQNISPEEVAELTEELAEMGVSLDEDDEFEVVVSAD